MAAALYSQSLHQLLSICRIVYSERRILGSYSTRVAAVLDAFRFVCIALVSLDGLVPFAINTATYPEP